MVLRCACASPVGSSVGGRANKKAEEEEKLLKLFQGVSKSQQDTFMQWCEQTLHTLNTANNLDGRPALIMGCCWGGSGHHTHPPPSPAAPPVPTFASFLKEVDSPYEVQDYVRAYLGDTPEAKDFAKQFVDRRAKQNTNQHKPAPPPPQPQPVRQQQVSPLNRAAPMERSGSDPSGRRQKCVGRG